MTEHPSTACTHPARAWVDYSDAGPSRVQRCSDCGAWRGAGQRWDDIPAPVPASDPIGATALDTERRQEMFSAVPEDEEALAATHALARARKDHPSLVDEAALSLWKEGCLYGLSVSRSMAADLAQARAFAEALRIDIWRMWQREWGPQDESDVGEWPLPWDGEETVVQTREAFWAEYGEPPPSAFSNLLEVTKGSQLDTTGGET